jgi:hypothetical protein
MKLKKEKNQDIAIEKRPDDELHLLRQLCRVNTSSVALACNLKRSSR